MVLRTTLLFAITAALGLCAPRAFAAEAYLCGPDNVVYVETENLEAMKRSDPCIAAFYGLKVEPKTAAVPANAPPAAALTSPTAAKSIAVTIPAPLNVTPVEVARAPAKQTPTLEPTPVPSARQVVRDLRPRIASDETWSASGDAQDSAPADAAPVVAAVGTDFRNVRVINASSPSEMWFKHIR